MSIIAKCCCCCFPPYNNKEELENQEPKRLPPYSSIYFKRRPWQSNKPLSQEVQCLVDDLLQYRSVCNQLATTSFSSISDPGHDSPTIKRGKCTLHEKRSLPTLNEKQPIRIRVRSLTRQILEPVRNVKNVRLYKAKRKGTDIDRLIKVYIFIVF